MSPTPETAEEFIDVSGRRLHIRHYGREGSGPPLVFLHEGLGSVDLWRSFPNRVVDRSGHPGLAFSRYGNGWSTQLAEPRRPDYMHVEALEVLPQVVEGLGLGPPILIGHSDGASIAVVYAGSGLSVRALVLIAPHVFVEPETVASIAAIKDNFPTSDMAEKMAKYHQDPEATFHGWSDIWLNPAFRTWNIEECLPGVRCPAMLVQGDADAYGTIKQLDAIDAGLANSAERLVVRGAGHSPHLSHSDQVTDAVVRFIAGLA